MWQQQYVAGTYDDVDTSWCKLASFAVADDFDNNTVDENCKYARRQLDARLSINLKEVIMEPTEHM